MVIETKYCYVREEKHVAEVTKRVVISTICFYCVHGGKLCTDLVLILPYSDNQ